MTKNIKTFNKPLEYINPEQLPRRAPGHFTLLSIWTAWEILPGASGWPLAGLITLYTVTALRWLIWIVWLGSAREVSAVIRGRKGTDGTDTPDAGEKVSRDIAGLRNTLAGETEK